MRFCVCKSASTPTTPPCPTPNTCIQLCSPIVRCADAVGPCSEVGQTDISVLDHDFGGCTGETPKYYLVDFETEKFIDMTLTEAGVLTWTTGISTVAGEFGYFAFKVYCGELSAIQTGLICIKDLCLTVGCAPGQECDTCTGVCVDQEAGLSIEKSSGGEVLIGSVDLSIQKTSS
jgi:hypothetical protein